MRARSLSFLLLVAIPCLASADEVSGRASGVVESRASTFHERRTDVVAPSLDARIDLANGMRLRGHYLLDAITSASVAVDVVSGASVGVDPLARSTFVEHRQEGAIGVGGDLANDSRPMTLDGSFRYSHEPDYQSYAGSVVASIAWDERTNLVSLGATVIHDEVRQTVRMADPSTGEIVRSVERVDQGDGFDGFVASLGATRVLSRFAILDVGYEVGLLAGYLGNPYRRVLVDGYVVRERVPDRRARHTVSLALRLARPRVGGALHLSLRGYSDDWSIRSVTTQARWYQRAGRYLMLRGGFRYYVQTAAFFDSGQDVIAPSYFAPVRYTTANPRYAAMASYELGAAAVTRLAFFGVSRHGLEDAEVELAVDYRFATNRFGNGITAAFAMRIPFR